MSQELVIYTDESDKSGQFYANFYGGALVRSGVVEHVNTQLRRVASEVGFNAEVKWQKVSSGYLDRYLRLIDFFFDLVRDGHIKVRIMFTQTRNVRRDLTAYQREHTYHLLYYQFLKHAFGLRHCNPTGEPIRLRIYLDNLPDTREKNALFKQHVAGLGNSRQFRAAKILVPQDQIAEVRSHDHIILQCLDVVLGAMQFRLNNKHKEKADGAHQRGARTIAKEKLYKHINARVRQIYPHFNIGISTGTPGGPVDRWTHPYRHWLFVPREAVIDNSRGKRGR
ncbi:MAG TPA: DUF3800 domain-containing protein [Longimicrobium sp.]